MVLGGRGKCSSRGPLEKSCQKLTLTHDARGCCLGHALEGARVSSVSLQLAWPRRADVEALILLVVHLSVKNVQVRLIV